MLNTVDGTQLGTGVGRDVQDPATLEIIDSVDIFTSNQIDLAVRAAHAAFPAWSRSSDERRHALTACAKVLTAHEDEIALLLSREQGKPLAQAYSELRGSQKILEWYAAVDDREQVLRDDAVERIIAQRLPIGVVAIITPWNFPMAILGMKLWATLRAGNTAVVKPASTTPLSTLRTIQLISEVLPAGVVNTVTGSGAVGGELAAHPLVGKVSFTGSTAVGREVMAAATPGLKRLTLELGGNDPAILLDDVDLDQALPILVRGSFHNAGQVCQAIKRIFVPRHLEHQVVEGLASLADSLYRVGRGTTDGVTMGPVNNAAQQQTIARLVEDARSRGAIVREVGSRDGEDPGYFVQPTIVSGLEADAPIVVEEQFGPTLPVVVYDDIDATIARLNREDYGLDASLWSRDVDRAVALSLQLQVGQSFVNTHAGPPDPEIPFGGVKASGFGRELGEQGLHEASELRILKIHKAV